ncbi:uncharacterized protein METZ01_LOCUS37822 [marine metagenome]|uniref:Uncharacterized protein n=1 Tax=marine metagenome TaxID=408172 RepID=A0A381R295_9ZZZZ
MRRQKAILNGNKITTEIWNYGSISSPGNRVTDIVWEGLGYGYEFGPFICAEVEVSSASHQDAYPKVSAQGDTTWYARVISDGLTSLGGEVSPDGTEFYGWEPLAFNDDLSVPYADPLSENIPTSNDLDRNGDGKPDSWPFGWYNENLKDYVWPGALRQGSSNSDLESFFVVDDRNNKEFNYFPFSADSTRRGLGIEIECRYYQWANPLAEDIIFLIYKVTNKSSKDLEEVTFGMWGDPHVGGPSNWQDDLSYFDRDLNMVYCWDADNVSDVVGNVPGYFGYKFLESPGQPYDNLDNDNDGMVDESQDNGIDDDGDWNVEKHDVGIDGVPNTGDEGEDDGVPTPGDPFDLRLPGEPNIDWTDLDESDMVGLTGFASPPFTSQNRISNDQFIFENYLTPGIFDTANSVQAGDYIFIYSSGPINLPAGEARRFSIALLVGQDYDDLTLNAITAQDIYKKNYQFAKPPEKPNVTAVPGDEKITLYWDDIAEDSFDPITETYDFEGYVIYRSTDPSFLDQQTITDANGSRFLFEPLKTVDGASAKFDLVNDYYGLSPIEFSGRGVKYNLGDNSGLRHVFVDSNNVVNGQTYYYAVVSYDHGDAELVVAPAECSKTITVNPETNEVMLDVNTVAIVPKAPTAGYVASSINEPGLEHIQGKGTGDVVVDIIDNTELEDENSFQVIFSDEGNQLNYSLLDQKELSDTITVRMGQYSKLSHKNVDSTIFSVSSLDGNLYTEGIDFDLLDTDGQIYVREGGSMTEGQTIVVSYRYYPIRNSEKLAAEEGNPIFDGMTITVQNDDLELDNTLISWNEYSPNNWTWWVKPFNNLPHNMYPADYEIRWFSSLVSSNFRPGHEHVKASFEIWETTRGFPEKQLPFVILETITTDSLWNPGERIIILQDSAISEASWELTFYEPSAGTGNVPPVEGDIFSIYTNRPFADDIFTFSTTASTESNQVEKENMDNIYVVPNPYVVSSNIESLDLQNPRDRGPRRVYFANLPAMCTIKIYTMAGDLVRTLKHEGSIENGIETWDLTTSDNFPVSFGIYIFHVESENGNESVGRFALIK